MIILRISKIYFKTSMIYIRSIKIYIFFTKLKSTNNYIYISVLFLHKKHHRLNKYQHKNKSNTAMTAANTN